MESRNNKLKLITYTAILMTLTCVMTLVIRIPTPTKGYVNLGDCVVLLSGWLMGPIYGTVAGGLGSALADLIAGYPVYIPGTFIIKALMSFIMATIPNLIKIKNKFHIGWIIGAIIAELTMVIGYYLYEAILIGEGFVPALAGIPGNIMQGATGIISAYFIAGAIRHTNIYK